MTETGYSRRIQQQITAAITAIEILFLFPEFLTFVFIFIERVNLYFFSISVYGGYEFERKKDNSTQGIFVTSLE